ncbi:MAG: VacJ family lipoprotein [Hyphomicrobiales bacterium]|nr:VacJ family lipoprotein [Hyphomicrobiales bacterium]MBV9426779.1 VacJ family lipoprotein [Bradyrhizobiaceae bacterium]
MPVNDPQESVNRHVMAANQEALRPPAQFVKTAIPGPVHDRVHDFNSNLREPRIFVNNVLQGRLEAAAKTGTRFVVNSVFGIAGIFDVAAASGLPQQSGDFGQTLFVWGVAEGPYVVRPYLGPATVRDAVGSAVDMVSNPVGMVLVPTVAMTVGSTGVDAVDRLGQLKMAEDSSIDFYSFVRSSYYQMRRAELREALSLPPVVESPALDDPDAEPATAAASIPAPAATGSAWAPTAPVTARSAAAPATKRAASVPKAKHFATASRPASGSPAAASRSAPQSPAFAAGDSALLAQ